MEKWWVSNHYEEFVDKDNKVIDTGEIIFANLNLQDSDLQLYKYEYEKNKIGLFWWKWKKH